MRFLVADIGGTNARFALAGAQGLEGAVVVEPTRSVNVPEVAERFGAIDAVCMAVAGPVHDGRARLTNAALSLDQAELSRELGVQTHVINDFTAVSYGMLAFDHLLQVGGGTSDQGAVRAAIGPGSGCGMGALVPAHGRWVALASEGGHADLAPASALEAELWAHLSAGGQVSWETVLCGPGLVRLYQAVCQLWGAPPEDLSSEEVTRRGTDLSDPICHQTLETFCAMLGTAAGGLAVTLLARGGVYIAGGIVPKMAEYVASSPLRRRFDERGAMTELAQSIPLFIVRDEHPGLIGALSYLKENADG